MNKYEVFDPSMVSHTQDDDLETHMAQEAEQMDLSTTLHYNVVISTLIRDYNYQINLSTLPTDSSTHHSLSEYFWANYKRDKKICALQVHLASQPPITTINNNTPTAPTTEPHIYPMLETSVKV
jgi:hypothetical protein